MRSPFPSLLGKGPGDGGLKRAGDPMARPYSTLVWAEMGLKARKSRRRTGLHITVATVAAKRIEAFFRFAGNDDAFISTGVAAFAARLRRAASPRRR